MASLAVLLASGALLAGCGTAAPEVADVEDPEPAMVAIPAPPEQDGAAADDAAGNASGIVTTGGDQGEGGQGQADEGRGQKSDGRADDGGDQGQAREDQGEEGQGSADDGRGMGEQTAVVHLVPAANGATSLLVEVGVTDGLAVADAPQGIGGLDAAEPSEVTLEEMEGAMVTAVMMADSPEGPLPEELDARCELLDGGRHALCEVAGTPDGGGDGTWYGTLQPGCGDCSVLATKLPA